MYIQSWRARTARATLEEWNKLATGIQLLTERSAGRGRERGRKLSAIVLGGPSGWSPSSSRRAAKTTSRAHPSDLGSCARAAAQSPQRPATTARPFQAPPAAGQARSASRHRGSRRGSRPGRTAALASRPSSRCPSRAKAATPNTQTRETQEAESSSAEESWRGQARSTARAAAAAAAAAASAAAGAASAEMGAPHRPEASERRAGFWGLLRRRAILLRGRPAPKRSLGRAADDRRHRMWWQQPR